MMPLLVNKTAQKSEVVALGISVIFGTTEKEKPSVLGNTSQETEIL